MSCTNYCHQNSRARNKPSGSMSMVVYRNGYRQTIYRPVEPQGVSKTCDFSRAAMEERWQQGTSDARKRRSKVRMDAP